LIIQTLTTTVYTAGITPETTLVFKAAAVILVCLAQAPKFRALVRSRWTRRRTPPAVAPVGSAGSGAPDEERTAEPTSQKVSTP
jgi:simple sugar transport system permease protein